MAEKQKLENKAAKLVEIKALKNKGNHMKVGKTYKVGTDTAKVLIDKKFAVKA